MVWVRSLLPFILHTVFALKVGVVKEVLVVRHVGLKNGDENQNSSPSPCYSGCQSQSVTVTVTGSLMGQGHPVPYDSPRGIKFLLNFY